MLYHPLHREETEGTQQQKPINVTYVASNQSHIIDSELSSNHQGWLIREYFLEEVEPNLNLKEGIV